MAVYESPLLCQHSICPISASAIVVPPNTCCPRVRKDQAGEHAQGLVPCLQRPQVAFAPISLAKEAYMLRLGQIERPIVVVVVEWRFGRWAGVGSDDVAALGRRSCWVLHPGSDRQTGYHRRAHEEEIPAGHASRAPVAASPSLTRWCLV